MSPRARAVVPLYCAAVLAAVVNLNTVVVKAHPCDPEHETHCPTSGPDTLGECIGKVADSDLSDSCKDWIKLHKECSEEFEGKCAESAWSNDSEPCVKTWTQRSDLSEKCKAFVPEPEKPKEEELTPEQKKRKAERKRIREEAAARARGEDKTKKSKKKKGKKAKKAKKESEEL